MKKFIQNFLLILAVLLFSSCSRTLDDITKWEISGNYLKLVDALEDKDVSIGIAAAEALRNLKNVETILPLAACLNHTNDILIITAVEALASIEDPNTITPLTAALRLDQKEAQSIAIEALGTMKATGAISTMGQVLPTVDVNQKLLIIRAFEAIESEEAIPFLIKLTEDAEITVQEESLHALGEIGGNGIVDILIKSLASDNHKVTKAAADALIKRGKESINPLIQELQSSSERTRNQSIVILKKLKSAPTSGPNSIWFKLATAAQQLRKDNDPKIIGQIALEKWVETLLDVTAHSNQIMRNLAVAALEEIGEPAVQASLKRADILGNSWYNDRNQWAGAPDWRIDLWAAAHSLQPNLFDSPCYEVPNLIKQLNSEEEAKMAAQTLKATIQYSYFPLIAALNQTPIVIAEQAALILSDPVETKALKPLMKRVKDELDQKQVLVNSPLNEALQRFQSPEAEPLLEKIRPNTNRALRCFERHFIDTRAISAEKITSKNIRQEKYRIGYISTGRVQDYTLTFVNTPDDRWIIQPELPDNLP